MSWIKIRTNLHDDPAVWEIAEALQMESYAVIGRLHAMWAWFDSQATAENPWVTVSTAAMDKRLDCPGWCSAVANAGWLIIEGNRLGVPNFERHNGQSAKERALTQIRQTRHRHSHGPGLYRTSQPITPNAPITLPLRERDTSVTQALRDRYATVTEALHDKANQDKALACNAPTVTQALRERYESVTRPSQDRGERGERERRGEDTDQTPSPNQSISSNQIPNTQLTRLEQFVDQSPEARAAALAEYRSRIEAFKAKVEAEKATKGEGQT